MTDEKTRPVIEYKRPPGQREFITAAELSRRTNTPVAKIRTWKAKNHIPTNEEGHFEWPTSSFLVKALNEKTQNYSKRVAPNTPMRDLPGPDGYPTPSEYNPPAPEDLAAEEATPGANRELDIHNLSVGQKIIDELQKRIKGSEGLAYQFGRALNEVVKSRKTLLELLEMEGKYLPRNEVETWVYSMSRQNRDMWMNWPQRIATEMAEELGVSGKLMNDVLMKHVRKNLDRVATLPSEYRAVADDTIPERTEAATED